jgi:hypothetical protein
VRLPLGLISWTSLKPLVRSRALLAASLPRYPQLSGVLFSIAIIGLQAFAGAGLAQPPLCYFVMQLIEDENRNVDSVTSARQPINHEVTTASSAAPLEN